MIVACGHGGAFAMCMWCSCMCCVERAAEGQRGVADRSIVTEN